LAKLRWW